MVFKQDNSPWNTAETLVSVTGWDHEKVHNSRVYFHKSLSLRIDHRSQAWKMGITSNRLKNLIQDTLNQLLRLV